MAKKKKRPGQVRDAIVRALEINPSGASTAQIERHVSAALSGVAASSVRSYLRLNTPHQFIRTGRGHYLLKETAVVPAQRPAPPAASPHVTIGSAKLINADCMDWLRHATPNSIHAVVTDPPYGLVEYNAEQQQKLRNGRGGVWRIPPSFDGTKRAPLPRFTVLSRGEISALEEFFFAWAKALLPVLVPGANVIVASNPLLSFVVSTALARAGLERRGELVRLVMTMRGGDRPKDAHTEFAGVSVMPRSMWEPWLLFRRPLDGRVQDNLRNWGVGGFKRPSSERPFGDVLKSAPTHKIERSLAPHPSLKPQAFLRQVVRAVLPLGKGLILDPFAGSGSTLAAAESVGYASVGIEKDPNYFAVARKAIPKLASFKPKLQA